MSSAFFCLRAEAENPSCGSHPARERVDCGLQEAGSPRERGMHKAAEGVSLAAKPPGEALALDIQRTGHSRVRAR